MKQDTIVKAVQADLQARSERGIAKYGTTLDRTDLTEKDWLQHAYEEALDLALYIKKLIELKGKEELMINMRKATNAIKLDFKNYKHE